MDAGPGIVEEFSGVTMVREAYGQVYPARNTGLQAAPGKVIAFTDADCVVSSGWLSCFHDAILVNGAFIVLGSIRFPSPKSEQLHLIEAYRNGYIDYVIEKNIRGHLHGYTKNMAMCAGICDRVGPISEFPVPGDTEIIHQCLRLLPETRLASRADMWMNHLEIVNTRILFRKLVLYGAYDFHLDMPACDESHHCRKSGAESYPVRKHAYSLHQRFYLRYEAFLCNSCCAVYTVEEWMERRARF